MKTIFAIARKFLVVLFVLFFMCDALHAVERPITVIIPSYNNKKWYKRNLDSVFSQKYSNYRVIYIDDCSPDGTADLVEQYVHSKKMGNKFQLVRNQVRQLALANIYHAVHSCDDHEIIAVLDGDDWWYNDRALHTINKAYEDPNIWLTYGRHIAWPSNRLGWGKPLSKKRVVHHTFRAGQYLDQQRTFYAWLFKAVKLEDLLCVEDQVYAGQFYPTNYDIAMMFPMIEMAAHHFKYVPNKIYVYNMGTQFNDWKIHRKKMVSFGRILRHKKPYQPADYSIKKSFNSPCVDHIVLRLSRRGYRASQIEGVANTVCIDDMKALQSTVAKCTSAYILVSDSAFPTDIEKAVDALEQTHARAAFFDQYDVNIPSIFLSGHLEAWQWKWACTVLQNPFKGGLFLVRTQDLVTAIEGKTITSLDDFHDALVAIFFEGKQVGLFVH